jgi:hypothetical protein
MKSTHSFSFEKWQLGLVAQTVLQKPRATPAGE